MENIIKFMTLDYVFSKFDLKDIEDDENCIIPSIFFGKDAKKWGLSLEEKVFYGVLLGMFLKNVMQDYSDSLENKTDFNKDAVLSGDIDVKKIKDTYKYSQYKFNKYINKLEHKQLISIVEGKIHFAMLP